MDKYILQILPKQMLYKYFHEEHFQIRKSLKGEKKQKRKSILRIRRNVWKKSLSDNSQSLRTYNTFSVSSTFEVKRSLRGYALNTKSC